MVLFDLCLQKKKKWIFMDWFGLFPAEEEFKFPGSYSIDIG